MRRKDDTNEIPAIKRARKQRRFDAMVWVVLVWGCFALWVVIILTLTADGRLF